MYTSNEIMDFTLIGTPCGQHGAYTFYKAFKFNKYGRTNILALSDFFFVKLWNDSDLVSIGELQLLWEDKNSEQTLASLRLYILPENTPEGRSDFHGEHEVLAITEKVVLRVEDLLTWITEAADWSWGLSAVYDQSSTLMPRPCLLSDNSVIDLTDVDKEKDSLGKAHWNTKSGVVVLSFPRYCRYRGIIKRLEGVHNKWLRTTLVVALGGFTVPCQNTRVLYCKDTFDYPDLEGHELLCNHLAPKLKGRPWKKRKLLDLSADSSDSESESSSVSTSSSTKQLKTLTTSPLRPQLLDGSIVRNSPSIQGGLHPRGAKTAASSEEEKEFLGRLHSFMKSRQTPINRVPTIGFKELNLYKLWSKVKHLGGFDNVSSTRMWKYVYEEMGGDLSSTSAATCCRRHYERLLLPFERHITPNRSKVSSLTKLKKFDEISIITKPGSVSMKPPNQDIRIKKQKLEILKEGGLEVTPVSGSVNGQSNSSEKRRPSVIQQGTNSTLVKNEKDSKEKVSITITPDVGHIFPKNRNVWSVGAPVYGNPKEVLQSDVRPTADEILDLRTKSPYAPVGSNLEITLIPPTSTNPNRGRKPQSMMPQFHRSNHTHKSSHPPCSLQSLQRQVHNQRLPSPSSNVTNGRGSSIIPSVSISVNHKQKSKSSIIPHPSQNVSDYKAGAYPMVDPVYLSAIYSGLFSPFSPTTSSQQLQVYKELLHRQNIPDSFPRLLQDGSTSISLVNQSQTPHQK